MQKQTKSKRSQQARAKRLAQLPKATIATLEKLRSQRERTEERAREHALQTALSYYKLKEEDLRRVVFANWLDHHSFMERFMPLKFIGR